MFKRLLITLCLLGVSVCYAKTDRVLEIQHWETKKGTRVLFVERPELPIIDIKVAFRAGSAKDKQHLGLAYLTASLLDQGAKGKNADAIAEEWTTIGAQYNSDVSRDASVLSLRSLTDNDWLPRAIDLFSTITQSPTFPKRDFLRLKAQQLSAISEQQQSPSSLATVAFYSELFKKQPYAHPILGTEKSVKAIQLSDVRTFYQSLYQAKNAVIVIVGAVSRQQAQAIAETLLESLPKGQPAELESQPSLTKASQQIIHFPSTQTNIRIGQVGIDRLDADYFPLMVGNHVLGGGTLTSRLNQSLRERQGLTYHIYSTFIPMLERGPFMIGLATRHQEAKKATESVREILQQFIKKGPTEAELKEAKNYLVGSFLLKLASNKSIAQHVLGIGFYHLPLNYLDTYRDQIKAVTREHIIQAFQKHVHPTDMVTIVVGA